VIEALVRAQLGGEIVRHWEAGGLVCDITLPVGRVIPADGRERQAAVHADGAPAGGG
jgi:hypothetical protein